MPSILILNGGSSSIRFALYELGEPLQRRWHGQVEHIGSNGTVLSFDDPAQSQQTRLRLAASDRATAVVQLLDWLDTQRGFESVVAVGHRVVHGMQHVLPTLVSSQLLDDLHRISALDPQHLPAEIELIEQIRRRHPHLPQIACFDTAFHRTLPPVARLMPIPRRLEALGVQRFGFHGLSYAFVMQELARLGDPCATRGRAILAHLGNGASLAAIRDGSSVDTSMGFTPGAGLMMGTRSGDIDPGLAYFLARTEQMTAQQFQHMVNHESGLLGVSGSSSDMRELLALEASDTRAAEAVAMFCYQAGKWVGAFAAVLAGLDTLVFTGGIGEHAAPVRQRICDPLGFLGIELHAERNARNAELISTDTSRVAVRVIRTDEALMVARDVARTLRKS